MNSRFDSDDDEASFDNLMAFDTLPPPPGESPEDVHSARTAVAELPDSFLESLKNKVATRASRMPGTGMMHAHPPAIPREEPEEPEEPEAPQAPQARRDGREEEEDLQLQHLVATRRALAFELPIEAEQIYTPPPVLAVPELASIGPRMHAPDEPAPPEESVARDLLLATLAVLLVSATMLLVWALLLRFFG